MSKKTILAISLTVMLFVGLISYSVVLKIQISKLTSKVNSTHDQVLQSQQQDITLEKADDSEEQSTKSMESNNDNKEILEKKEHEKVKDEEEKLLMLKVGFWYEGNHLKFKDNYKIIYKGKREINSKEYSIYGILHITTHGPDDIFAVDLKSKTVYEVAKGDTLLIIKEMPDIKNNNLIFPFTSPSNIFENIYLSKKEVFSKYGYLDYTVVDARMYNSEKGYYFKRYGLTFGFDENDNVLWIKCENNIRIVNTCAGMSLSDIEKKIGEENTKDKVLGDKFSDTKSLEYYMGGCRVLFSSKEEDGSNASITIFKI